MVFAVAVVAAAAVVGVTSRAEKGLAFWLLPVRWFLVVSFFPEESAIRRRRRGPVRLWHRSVVRRKTVALVAPELLVHDGCMYVAIIGLCCFALSLLSIRQGEVKERGTRSSDAENYSRTMHAYYVHSENLCRISAMMDDDA